VSLSVVEHSRVAEAVSEEHEAEASHDSLFLVFDDADFFDLSEVTKVVFELGWVSGDYNP
jgi:predicted nuclease of predicted toxin-antitoxin system